MPERDKQRDPQLELERAQTNELLVAAESAATEGAAVLERLRLATEQYRERLGIPPATRRPR